MTEDPFADFPSYLKILSRVSTIIDEPEKDFIDATERWRDKWEPFLSWLIKIYNAKEVYEKAKLFERPPEALEIVDREFLKVLREKAEKWDKAVSKANLKIDTINEDDEPCVDVGDWITTLRHELSLCSDRLEAVKDDLVNLSRTYDPAKTTWKYIELWCEFNRRLSKHFGTDWMEEAKNELA